MKRHISTGEQVARFGHQHYASAEDAPEHPPMDDQVREVLRAFGEDPDDVLECACQAILKRMQEEQQQQEGAQAGTAVSFQAACQQNAQEIEAER